MGEVYRARDTRLDRTVAIKVLPEHVAANPEARQRFEREARAVSSLNHPHICVLHDIGQQDGVDFLVMEYLEGETLGARLAKGPLPVPQALRYGIEIADALAQAHRQGVFHRDLKPGNIMLTRAGAQTIAKLLDFGLAKRARTGSGAADEPTVSADLTGRGTLLGTVPYMAPEQLQGREADARTDIFAFGVVLYEMVAGRRPFTGETVANLIAAILEHEPPPLPGSCPVALDRVVKRCLAKDPEERCQSAWDLKAELEWVAEGASAQVTPAPGWTLRRLVPWLATALFAALAAILAVLHFRAVPPVGRTVRFLVSPPERGRNFDFPAISPDGERLALLGLEPDKRTRLWVRSLDAVTAEPLADGVERGRPYWSPDSRSIAFSAGGKLLKVDVRGGPPQTICDAPPANLPGGAWSRDGVILFHTGFPGHAVLYRVAAAGGEATPATTLDVSRQEVGHYWPQFLADGRRFLYFVRSTRPENTGIYVGALDSKESRRLLSTDHDAAYAGSPSGPSHLLFVQGTTLMARTFDAQQLILAGQPFPVAEQVFLPPGQLQGRAAFTVSGNGVLAYGTASGTATTELVWLGRQGQRLGTVGEPDDYSVPALSPDEKKLVVSRMNPQSRTRDLWLFDLVRGTSSRFTFDPTDKIEPVWSPDGSRVAFTDRRKGPADIYRKAATGAGEAELLRESGVAKELMDWSPDGRLILFGERGAYWALPLEGDHKPIGPLPIGSSSAISPNGRWVAYQSNESGRVEVYVQSFPPSGGKWQVSAAEGFEPQWRRDGKELFYIARNKLMVAEVQTDSLVFRAGTPQPLFDVRLVAGRRNRYQVAANGQRFLVNLPLETALPAPITVVVNWTAGLKR